MDKVIASPRGGPDHDTADYNNNHAAARIPSGQSVTSRGDHSMHVATSGLAAEGAWETHVSGDAFKRLLAAKMRFILVMSAVFITFYIGLSVLAGFAKGLLATKVFGPINLGFVLIAANYLMSWAIAIIYARVAGRDHDPLVEAVVQNANRGGR